MTEDDPLLRMSSHQYRDLRAYESADPLGWLPKAVIALAGLAFGAGCATVLITGGIWRRLLG